MVETTTFMGLGHMFMTIFLHSFSAFMVIPAITDVTMAALCPGEDECSLAIYLSGFQQAVSGLGSLLMMPIVGTLSDTYGRKALLTLPMSLAILPLASLAYSRTTTTFYVYYVLKTLTSTVCEGSVHCLALAYVADNVSEQRRASAFGILSGIGSCAFVCGTLSARFLSTSATFQVAATVAVLSTVYMRLFLPDSIADNSLTVPILSGEKVSATLPKDKSDKKFEVFRTLPSVQDMVGLLKSSVPLLQAAIVSFFSSLGDAGLQASTMYYLKAKFHFNKDQFADLMVIYGAAGSISQLLFMPILVHGLGEEIMLSIGLFFGCANMFLLSVAWSAWVPYTSAAFSVFSILSQPSMRSIVSKQVATHEQGKAQGIISSICSFASVISPLAFSPLTDLFLSDRAPFNFPGFSIMCIGFTTTIAFIQSLMIRATPPMANHGSP
ncbi:PREDICTED: hippocampus abundant transcript-like protein 1 isoform X2 [Tarenaya hassleriana]|uniref:hippocampus abundant transcript-like protein 1 isoform X2 n=1 Tax=Tarenaya hassleriana TaxID=28532 RepID=UPI00053C5DB2|nr:PREDICTED: hippocampus abundant transcript-like protein 1 isoform X2 [Tarenaya hassleriana]